MNRPTVHEMNIHNIVFAVYHEARFWSKRDPLLFMKIIKYFWTSVPP